MGTQQGHLEGVPAEAGAGLSGFLAPDPPRAWDLGSEVKVQS